MEESKIRETCVIRLKKNNLKISASLSAIFNSLDLIPNKVLKDIADVSEGSPFEKFYVKLYKFEDNSYKVELKESPDSSYLKEILKNPYSKKDLEDYAKSTLNKSRARTLEKRMAEIEGILRSYKK